MAGEFTKGIRGGLALRKATETPLETPLSTILLKGVRKAKERRRKEDLEREKEDRLLEGALQKIAFQEELSRETGRIEARGKRELERVKGEETRKTEAAKPKPPTIGSLLETLQRTARGPTGGPIVPGPGGRLITGKLPEEIPIEGTRGLTQADLLRQFGLRPTLTGGKIGVESITGGKGFKPFQLTPETEADFKTSVQKGLSLLQGQTVNPATGEPFTKLEIFRALAVDFPGQVSKLKTIFLSGKAEESFEDVLFGE